uniref:THUMP domain-containing protein n=1 Tax=Pongo abelii TaxID=9601 RepID=A0A8I5YL22_PONAB
MNREDVIKELAGIVGTLNSENKVHLTNPQYTVLVEIIRAVCCLSVMKDYMFRKYNLQEVVKSPKDPSQFNPKQENGKEAILESADKSDQNNPAEGKNNQQTHQGFATNAERRCLLFVNNSLYDDCKCQRLPLNKAWIQLQSEVFQNIFSCALQRRICKICTPRWWWKMADQLNSDVSSAQLLMPSCYQKIVNRTEPNPKLS